MKKKIFCYTVIVCSSFLISCDDNTTQTTVVRSGDSSKTTIISIGSGGADVNSKNTQIKVDSNGIKIGTKTVKIDIKK